MSLDTKSKVTAAQSILGKPTITEERAELATALADAQAEIDAAPKTESNPFFKSTYADLATVRAAIRDAFGKHGLSVIQIPQFGGGVVSVTTILLHKSGQYIEGTLAVQPVKDRTGFVTPQAVGSAITYARRYSLMAFAGVAPDDDDGNEASQPAKQEPSKRQSAPAKEREEPNYFNELKAVLERAGVAAGDKDTAGLVVRYCTGGKHTLTHAYNSPEICRKVLDLVASGWREFPPESETPLLKLAHEWEREQQEAAK